MKFESRAELEKRGNNYAEAIERDDFYFSRMLGSYWVAISKDDSGLSPHIKDGFWESWISVWVSKNVAPGSKCADLGANVGYYTYLLADQGCEVDAYEPNPKVFKLLEEGFKKNKNLQDKVTLLNEAVARHNRTVDFTVPINHPMNGTLTADPVYAPYGTEVIKVKCSNALKKTEYDFIKVDVEGGEEDVFGLLDADLHPLVLLEFRWDRYKKPEEFISRVYDTYKVAYVNFEGSEIPVDVNTLRTVQNADWMLVLRA